MEENPELICRVLGIACAGCQAQTSKSARASQKACAWGGRNPVRALALLQEPQEA